MEAGRIASLLQSAGSVAVRRIGLALSSQPQSGVAATLLGSVAVAAVALPIGFSSGWSAIKTFPMHNPTER